MIAALKSGFRRAAALAGYCAVIGGLVAFIGIGLADLYDRSRAVASAKEFLEQLDGRKKPAAEAGVHVLGLPWLHTWGSGRFAGVAEDARHVAAGIAQAESVRSAA